MAKYGKYKSIQELLEAKQGGISIIDNLEGVVENMQKLRNNLKNQKDNDRVQVLLITN